MHAVNYNIWHKFNQQIKLNLKILMENLRNLSPHLAYCEHGLMQPRLLLTFSVMGVHYWLIVNLKSTGMLRSSSLELLLFCASLSWAIGLFLPRYWAWHFSLLKLMPFFLSEFSRLSMFSERHCNHMVYHSIFSVLYNLQVLRVHFFPVFQVASEDVKQMAPVSSCEIHKQ